MAPKRTAAERILDVDFRIHFMVIGTQRGGTTALDEMLRQHPDISMAVTKEIHYFDQDFASRLTSYCGYHIAFRNYNGQAKVGEATPTYMFLPHIIKRLHAYNPMLHLIVLLRHPVERAYSHYRLMVRLGLETLSFADAIAQEASRLAKAAADTSQGSPLWRYSYLARSRYALQIENILRWFPEQQILFLRSESMALQPDAVLDAICQFLEISPWCGSGKPKSQLSHPSIDSKLRRHLVKEFDQDARMIEAKLGWDLEFWSR